MMFEDVLYDDFLSCRRTFSVHLCAVGILCKIFVTQFFSELLMGFALPLYAIYISLGQICPPFSQVKYMCVCSVVFLLSGIDMSFTLALGNKIKLNAH